MLESRVYSSTQQSMMPTLSPSASTWAGIGGTDVSSLEMMPRYDLRVVRERKQLDPSVQLPFSYDGYQSITTRFLFSNLYQVCGGRKYHIRTSATHNPDAGHASAKFNWPTRWLCPPPLDRKRKEEKTNLARSLWLIAILAIQKRLPAQGYCPSCMQN